MKEVLNSEQFKNSLDLSTSEGYIALTASPYEEAGVYVAFDNVKVWEGPD